MGFCIAILALLICMLLNSACSENWSRHSVLDIDGIYHLYWNSPGDKLGDREITFKVEVKTKGYFGLGFSPNGGMPGSDIVTGWIKDSKVYFQDRHATSFSLPPKDDQQDYELIDAYENDTCTVFKFSRKFNTCDENDMVIEEGTMRVIYAYSEKDPDFDDPFYHAENRGSKSTILLHSNVNEEQDLNLTSMSYWDALSPDVDLSDFTTLYWCKIYKSPEVSEKQHIVYIKPMIQEGHEVFVHHMLMYECVGGTAEEYEDLANNKGTECFHPEMPEAVLKCQGIFAAWAVGGQGTLLPEYVGLPIFPGPSKYYLLEIHYDNPFSRSGIIDHSGLRFFYTDNLRNIDAGNFMIGASTLPRVFIPPGQNEYIVVGHSTQECVGSMFPEGGVKAFAIVPHSHLLGRRFKVRHFRGNEELRPLSVENYYDFNYQDYQYFTDEVQILPNDQITVECTYDSSKESIVTFGGMSTKEEMCLAIILYYPLVNQYNSFSAPTFANINEVLNTNITQEEDVYSALGSYDWKNANIAELQNVMRYSQHLSQCDYGPFPEELPLVSYPKDLIPYVEESTCNTTVH